jgi:hypothetical protein
MTIMTIVGHDEYDDNHGWSKWQIRVMMIVGHDDCHDDGDCVITMT